MANVSGPGGAVRIESGVFRESTEFRDALEIDLDFDDLGLTSEYEVGTNCSLAGGTCVGCKYIHQCVSYVMKQYIHCH